MTGAEADAMVWESATEILRLLGFGAVLLLSLALIGLAGRW